MMMKQSEVSFRQDQHRTLQCYGQQDQENLYNFFVIDALALIRRKSMRNKIKTPWLKNRGVFLHPSLSFILRYTGHANNPHLGYSI